MKLGNYVLPRMEISISGTGARPAQPPRPASQTPQMPEGPMGPSIMPTAPGGGSITNNGGAQQ
jgi:hypothetical protein